MQECGKCSLCLKIGVSLLRSHYLPASSYRLLKKFIDGSFGVLSKTAVVQTDNQMTAHLLCGECEVRLRRGGEDWVMAHCYRPEGFKLRESLKLAPLKRLDGGPCQDGISAHITAGVECIDVKSLTYLAASIVWRGAVHSWKCGRETLEKVSIGPVYEESLRRYLLGETDFPMKAVCWITVIPNEKLLKIAGVPHGGKVEGEQFWRYDFPFHGILFSLFFGNVIDPVIRRTCAYRSPEHFIFFENQATDVIQRLASQLFPNPQPKGKLTWPSPPGQDMKEGSRDRIPKQ